MSAAFDAVSLEQLRRRRSRKWQEFPADVLPAFIAEMDFDLAPAVKSALAEAVALGDAGYSGGSTDLAESLAAFMLARYGWELDPSDVVRVSDVMVGITELLRVAARPGDGVVVNPPVYPPFFSHVVEAGCRLVEAPLAVSRGRYELDLEALRSAFAAGSRIYLLCNPHNPMGRVFSRADLLQVVELAERYGVLVLSDEIHAPLTLPGARHTPFLSLGESARARGIALVSASKGWNIPGLKCAQIVVASDPMRTVIRRLPEHVWLGAGNLGVVASVAAYRDGGGWLDELLAVLDRNRNLMSTLLAERLPGVVYRPPEAGYLGWLDCRGLGLPQEPVDRFLERGRVALTAGLRFGRQGSGHVRVTMATSREILDEIVERMHAAIA